MSYSLPRIVPTQTKGDVSIERTALCLEEDDAPECITCGEQTVSFPSRILNETTQNSQCPCHPLQRLSFSFDDEDVCICNMSNSTPRIVPTQTKGEVSIERTELCVEDDDAPECITCGEQTVSFPSPILNEATQNSQCPCHPLQQLSFSSDDEDVCLKTISSIRGNAGSLSECDSRSHQQQPPLTLPSWGDIGEQLKPLPRAPLEPLEIQGIYVLQGVPLFFKGVNGELRELQMLDYKMERQQLTQVVKESSRNKVDTIFDFLTVEAFDNFFSKQKGMVLHISAHGMQRSGGRPSCLAFEDERVIGQAKLFQMKDVAKWIVARAKDVKLVFIASCHSEILGQAMIGAGVKHVVCCAHNEEIQDTVEIDFESAFYKSLVCGDEDLTLQDVYDNALMVVKEMHGEEHANKFRLLPQTNDPTRHHVSVNILSKCQDRTQLSMNDRSKGPPLFPPPPSLYQSRPTEQHDVIMAILHSSFVSVRGEAGTGKTGLVNAVCPYIYERLHFNYLRFKITEIVWCPYDKRPDMILPWIQGDHSHYHHIQKIFDVIRNDEVSVDQFSQGTYSEYHFIGSLKRFLHERKVLLVIDAKELWLDSEAEKMKILTKILLSDAENIKILVIHNKEFDFNPGTLSITRVNVTVKPLNPRERVDLFIKCMPCGVVEKDRHGKSTRSELLNWIFAPNVLHILECNQCSRSQQMLHIAQSLFKILGEGYPGKIIDRASNMTAEKLDKLVSLRLEFNEAREHKTRAHLCLALREMRRQFLIAKGNGECKKTEDLRRKIEKLEKLKLSFKSLPELEELLFRMELEQAQAHPKSVVSLSRIKHLKMTIEKERDALNKSVEDQGILFLRIDTRAALEYEIDEHTRRFNKFWALGEINTTARKIKEDIKVLKDMRRILPEASKLQTIIADLRKHLGEAQMQMDCDVGEVIDRHLRAKISQLEREKEYTRTTKWHNFRSLFDDALGKTKLIIFVVAILLYNFLIHNNDFHGNNLKRRILMQYCVVPFPAHLEVKKAF
jgi:hypothetical protein